MNCLHCNEDTYNFTKLYAWPFGKKKCPNCGKLCSFRKDKKLVCASLALGFTSWIPLFVFDSPLLFLASLPVLIIVDYHMDKKYRVLINATAP